jgi:hypothetical protein
MVVAFGWDNPVGDDHRYGRRAYTDRCHRHDLHWREFELEHAAPKRKGECCEDAGAHRGDQRQFPAFQGASVSKQ